MKRFQFDLKTEDLTADQILRLQELVDRFLQGEGIDCPYGLDLWNVEEVEVD